MARSSNPAEPGPPRAELLQGTLDLLLLRILRNGANHGYGIAKRLREASAEVLLVEEGTLYPALHRLEKRGAIESEWQMTETKRRAKYYRLTADGKARLEAETSSWATLSGAIERVLAMARGSDPESRTSASASASARPAGAAS